MNEREAQIWEERVYAGQVPVVRGPNVVRFTTKAYLMRRFLDLSLADRVLDVGCGLGEFSLLAACQVRSVLGIDAAPTAVRAAQEAAKRFGIANASFQVGSAYELAATIGPAEPFDKVLCFDLLEHLSDPETVLAQIHGLLRPGGRALLFTNCFGTFTWAYLKEKRRTGGQVEALWESDRHDHHLTRFTPERLRAMTRPWKTQFIYKNHFLVPAASWTAGAIDRLWQKLRPNQPAETNTATNKAQPTVQVQTAIRPLRCLVQAATLATSVLEMETLGRVTPGAGVYMLLEKSIS